MSSSPARKLGSWLACMVLALGAIAAADAPRKAQPFTYQDINPNSPSHGKRLSLPKLYAERGVVLNFLASWCDYCWKELPDLDRLRQSKSAPIVGVAADEYGDVGPLRELLVRSRSTMPVLLVPKAEIEAMSEAYDHRVLPATYLIDRLGRILRVYQGLAPVAELSARIDSELVSAPSP